MLFRSIVKLNSARLDSITQVAYTGRNANTTSITFDSATAWGAMTVASTGGNISRNADGTGIGVCSGACVTDAESALNSSKSLSFKLTGGKKADKFALGVLSLDTTVELSVTFRNNGSDLPLPGGQYVSPLVSVTPGSLRIFPDLMPSPPAQFDEVVVRPRGTSRFFIASIRFCEVAVACN